MGTVCLNDPSSRGNIADVLSRLLCSLFLQRSPAPCSFSLVSRWVSSGPASGIFADQKKFQLLNSDFTCASPVLTPREAGSWLNFTRRQESLAWVLSKAETEILIRWQEWSLGLQIQRPRPALIVPLHLPLILLVSSPPLIFSGFESWLGLLASPWALPAQNNPDQQGWPCN